MVWEWSGNYLGRVMEMYIKQSGRVWELNSNQVNLNLFPGKLDTSSIPRDFNKERGGVKFFLIF